MHPLLLSQTQYDRPTEGLSRGRFAAPKWAIATLGAVIVVLALAYLAIKLRRALRGKG